MASECLRVGVVDVLYFNTAFSATTRHLQTSKSFLDRGGVYRRCLAGVCPFGPAPSGDHLVVTGNVANSAPSQSNASGWRAALTTANTHIAIPGPGDPVEPRDGAPNMLGRSVLVNRVPFHVVGILERVGAP